MATTGARGTNNILSNRIVVDMSDKISLLLPQKYPLTVLSKKIGTNPCHNYKFEWMEDTLEGRWVTFNQTTETVATATDINVGTGLASLCAVDDLVKNVKTGEIVRVTAIKNANEITVTRGYGVTAAALMTNADKLLILGNAAMQGSGAPSEKYNNPTAAFNYTQIFKTPFAVTNTLDKTKLYGGKELSRLQYKKGIEHGASIELSLLFGERKLDTTGAQPRTTTGGVLQFISGTSNVKTVAKASVVEKDLDEWMEKLFTYGSDERLVLCSASFISQINTWAKAKQQLQNMETKYGINIYTVTSPHGVLKLVKHPLLVQGYEGYSIALDMDNIDYRPLDGRDTKLQTNIQNNDDDGRRDQYITEAGLEIRMPQTHGMFILT